MSGTGKTGVVGADGRLDPIQHSLGQVIGIHELLGHQFHRVTHRPVVVAGGHDQIDPGYLAVFVSPVVVEQRTTWGFHHAHTLAGDDIGLGDDVGGEDVGVFQQFPGPFGRIDVLDKPRVVHIERGLHRPLRDGLEFLELFVGQRCADAIGHVQAAQWRHAIDTGWPAHLLVIWELEVGPVLHMLSDVIEVTGAVELLQPFPVPVNQTHRAVVQLQGTRFLIHHTHIARAEVGETLHNILVSLQPLLGQSETLSHVTNQLINGSQQLIALLLGERLVHPAGHRESGVDAPSGDDADDLLTVFAQLNCLECQLGISLNDAYHIADGRVGIETEDQIRSSQVEEVHRV
ncbi:MAG: hypothetical protein DDT26_02428 [Dehalococcoidia bacterium]|nr:hypothetical protein [Chloroflexota bacterium]